MNLTTDEVKANLTDGEQQRTLRSFTVVGKVLAADIVDIDRFQNHFLLTSAALGPQLLKTYDLGNDAAGKPVMLDTRTISDFFFKLLDGRIEPKELDAKFSLRDMINR